MTKAFNRSLQIPIRKPLTGRLQSPTGAAKNAVPSNAITSKSGEPLTTKSGEIITRKAA